MAIYNFGSVNIDHVYQVEHFVQPGETLSSNNYQQILGGKGANQSVALAKAGATVYHVGRLCKSDQGFAEQLNTYGVDCSLIELVGEPSGHAIIQVTPDAENAIVLFGGANQSLSNAQIDAALAQAQSGDWVLCQNETNALDYVFKAAKAKNLNIAFNPAPMSEAVKSLPLHDLDILIVNEVEASMLTGHQNVDDMIETFKTDWHATKILLTLGKSGVCWIDNGHLTRVDAFTVDAVDTTAAGDTFIGYFLAGYCAGQSVEQALTQASAASAIGVTRQGAAPSIPSSDEVKTFLQQR